jgi:hypothetical protein
MTTPREPSITPAPPPSRPRLYRDATATWVVMFALAFVNGAMREIVLAPKLGSVALPVSGLVLIVVLAAIAAAFVRFEPALTVRHAWRVGLLWLALTLAAEALLAGAGGRPLGDMAVLEGNLFAPAVLVLAISPVIWARLMGRR